MCHVPGGVCTKSSWEFFLILEFKLHQTLIFGVFPGREALPVLTTHRVQGWQSHSLTPRLLSQRQLSVYTPPREKRISIDFYLFFYKRTLSLLEQFNWTPKRSVPLSKTYCCSTSVFPADCRAREVFLRERHIPNECRTCMSHVVDTQIIMVLAWWFSWCYSLRDLSLSVWSASAWVVTLQTIQRFFCCMSCFPKSSLFPPLRFG